MTVLMEGRLHVSRVIKLLMIRVQADRQTV